MVIYLSLKIQTFFYYAFLSGGHTFWDTIDGTKYMVMDPDNNGRVYIGPFSYTTAKAGNTVYSYLERIDTNCQNNTIPLHRENPLKHFSFIINKKTNG